MEINDALVTAVTREIFKRLQSGEISFLTDPSQERPDFHSGDTKIGHEDTVIKQPLTEQEARQLLKKDQSIRSLSIPRGTLVTPLAFDFLKMKNITLNFTEADKKNKETSTDMPAAPATKFRAYAGPDGEKLETKPEELTHLYGNQLTWKNNPVILFRGKLDKLCAMILEAQALGERNGNSAYVNNLREILDFVRSLLPAEYNRAPLGEFRLLGLSSDDIRERSHHPEKYFGRGHLLMHYSMGDLCLRLNLLRTAVRETELAAVAVLLEASLQVRSSKDQQDTKGPVKRCYEDIVKALNRLSSLFYILIYEYLPKNYSPSGSAGI